MKVRRCFWIEEEDYAEIDKVLESSGCETKSDFVNKAIKFYTGFCRTKQADLYLLCTLSSTLDGIVGVSEERISRLLYKLAVEVAMQNRIIAYDRKFSEEAIDKIREISEDEVREIIGYWEKR